MEATSIQAIKDSHRAYWQQCEVDIRALARNPAVSDTELARMSLKVIDDILKAGDRMRDRVAKMTSE